MAQTQREMDPRDVVKVLELARQEHQRQLGLRGLVPLQTVVEKRATFACTPALARPTVALGPNLCAAGDYTEGPYPATLEGAVMSGLQAAQHLLHGPPPTARTVAN